MACVSKRFRLIAERVVAGKAYAIMEAIALLQTLPKPKFDESMEFSANLGIDPRKSDQNVRGSVVLPKGTGRVMRVAVFARGAQADAASAAGAEQVGFEDLAAAIKGGDFDFDILIATPEAMSLVGQLGQLLGPRGLMPNPKLGTVTNEVATAVHNAKSGQVNYRADKGGIVHGLIGKMSFQAAHLKQNLEAFLTALKKDRPTAAKGIYFKKISLSSTMGPGLLIDQSSFDTPL